MFTTHLPQFPVMLKYWKCIYLFVMSVITIRIDKRLRERMKALKGVNWSQVVREAILRKIEAEERKEVLKHLDKLLERVKPVSEGEIVRWIKEDRGR